jgi:hypothetical protein
LLQPLRDINSENERKNSSTFPAFTMAQFIIDQTKHLDGSTKVNIIGFYRKQEMKYWWPINVGELAFLLRTVVGRLRERGRKVSPGSITTFAAIAGAETRKPNVAISLVDRIYDEDPGALVKMAYGAVHPEHIQDLESVKGSWLDILKEFTPSDTLTLAGFSLTARGLTHLSSLLKDIMAASGKDGHAGQLASSLEGACVNISQLRSLEEGGRLSSESDRANIAVAKQSLRERLSDATRQVETLFAS